ncbi:MAG TPA: cytochrome c [Candidatus Angelobacter sp.]|nr:cytochrome c [Candidatus Angelobacter sp.]
MKRILSLVFFCVLPALCLFAGSSDWLAHVPARDRQKSNPYHDRPEAVAAGRLLFSEHCAQCHGDDASGKGKKPSVRTERVQSVATEGDLHWLLVNGNIRRGMPSWSKLPDQQLWQLVRYLKSLH